MIAEGFDHSRVTELRHSVASCAEAAGLRGDRLDDFVVAVNELLTNAVRHGGGAGRIRLWHDGDRVCCEVTDSGAGLPGAVPREPHRPASDQPGGWGLWLAGELTDSLDIVTGRDGTTVQISSRI